MPSRGSIWRKWDLHIHTPESILSNGFPRTGGEFDWAAYCTALEGAGLAVIGVTDYFTVDGYRKLKQLQGEGRLQGIRLLPNVEFRLDQVLAADARRPGARLNAHVIFSDELDIGLIEEHFLHDLRFTAEGRPQESHQQRKLKKSNLEALGNDLQKEHARFREMPALEVGATQAVVSLKEIAELLSGDNRFAGKYLIVLGEIYTSDIPWDGQDHQVRKVMLQASDMVFTSNPKSRAWHLGKPPYMEGPDSFVAEFNSLKACIHGSDAHDLETIGKPCAKRGERDHDCTTNADCAMRHCWIKADPTFEGLRQLLYEPEARVRCQETDPTPVKSPHSIDAFSIEGVKVSTDLSLAETELRLNPQLVAVVGGRGGGKTALVDLIANCFADRSAVEDANSFVKRIAEEPPNVNTTITFVNGTTFRKEVVDGRVYEDTELVYIAQGELEDQVTDAAALTSQIDSMVLESTAVTDTVKRYDLDQAAKHIDVVTRELESRNKEVARLEQAAATSAKGDVEGAIKKKGTSIEDISKRIEAARAKLSAERAAEAEEQQKLLAALRDKAQKQKSLKALLDNAGEAIRDSATAMGNVIEDINAQLEALGMRGALPAFQYTGTEKLTELTNAVQKESELTAKAIEAGSKALANLAGEQEALARVLDQKKKAEGELATLKERLAGITRAEGQLAAARIARSESLRALARSVIARRQKYREVIALFASNKDRLLNDLEFAAEVSYDDEDLLARAEELLDGRSARIKPSKGEAGELDQLVTLARTLIAAEAPNADTFVAEAERLLEALRPKLKEARATNPLAIHDLVFHNYFAFKPSVTYKRLPLGKLSLGQKATVLLKIHLANGSNPIIIDSHDDHLDNEFIMDELVEGIRQAKEYRQVILVSNNGNVVVNSDAEQVIIADHAGATISYQTGSLEDPATRERLIKVLEGGSDAFKQRGKKYRLQR